MGLDSTAICTGSWDHNPLNSLALFQTELVTPLGLASRTPLVFSPTVRLSSNDHPEIGEVISRLQVFKTRLFKVAFSSLAFIELNTSTGLLMLLCEFNI